MRNVFITLANISWVVVIVYFDPTDIAKYLRNAC